MSPFEFVDEVDQADPRTFVVIHLYEDFVDHCRKLNIILDHLARKFEHVKFLKLKAIEAREDYDIVALPTVMLYKGGQLIEAMVRITDEVGTDFDLDDIEWMLQARDVFEASLTTPAPDNTRGTVKKEEEEDDEY